MAEPLYLLPDAELWATGYLREALGVYVSNRVPDPVRDRMVVVRRVGGVGDRFVDRPRLQVRVFAESEDALADLLPRVRAALLRSPGNGPARRAAESGGPVTVPNPVQEERLLTYDLILRGGIA